ncbi:NUDIX hydrolase [Acrocarpospora catenulata]|uniref:NUDIX hydrolase n=1 Tax=Acrocarpospora catenulata TaxID=2836182 RepID=UPI001BDA1DF8|nr:NUDIX domain-containing protein [Acrocarpospora catenulata]
MIVRPSARVLILDDADRILLYRALSTTENPDYAWITPGGGVNPGEDLATAAARELREETGHRVAPEDLGPVVAVSSGPWESAEGVRFYGEDSFFLLRVPHLEVDVSGMEELESSLLDTFRWWTLPELRAATERVLPYRLAELLETLLHRIPAEPIVLPWHL